MNKTELKKILAASAIDPKNPGALGIIIETGDPRYLMARSRELIRECEFANDSIGSKLQTAVALLAIAQYKLQNKDSNATEKRKKSKDNRQQHQGDSAQLQADGQNRQQSSEEHEEGKSAGSGSGL